jgi:hypothetical protein
MIDLTNAPATTILTLLAPGIAWAQGNMVNYETWAVQVESMYKMLPTQWAFVLAIWEKTKAAGQDIYIEQVDAD